MNLGSPQSEKHEKPMVSLPIRRTLARSFRTAFIMVIFAMQAVAQAELPPDVRADILLRKILDSARANDLPGALTEIDEYKSLKVPVPPTLLLVEAKAAHRTGDPLRAFNALKAFLAVGQRGSKGYDEALSLYSEFEKEAAPGLKVQEEKKAADAAEASRLRSELQLKIQSATQQCVQDEPREERAAIDQCAKKHGSSYRACVAQFPEYFSYDNHGRSRAFDDCFRAVLPLCKNLKTFDPSADDDSDDCHDIDAHLKSATSYTDP